MKKNEFFLNGLNILLENKRSQKKITGWFVYQEIKMTVRESFASRGLDPDAPENQGDILCECLQKMPLSIPRGSVLAGTQDDAFSPSYALINPAFRVETFAGYCDPVAVYDDIAPDEDFSAERIARVRDYYSNTKYVRQLKDVYKKAGALTEEVAYFAEPVTGHIIPDIRPILKQGIKNLSRVPEAQMIFNTMQGAVILAQRYAELARKLVRERMDDPEEAARLELIAENCSCVPENGAANLHQVLQSLAIVWQVMCLEQSPNPYAFSIGNLDRIIEPFCNDIPADEAVVLIRHFLAFLMVGNRCWAISQNIMAGGRDADGNDLTSPATYLLLDAFFESNNPQPALSVKLHKNTPDKLYDALGRFFFTPGHSTASFFNDDMMFKILEQKGVSRNDFADYAIAGCQEPLIMGKESANTTNSWLNLAKVLELTVNDGCSLLTGKKLGLSRDRMGYTSPEEVLEDIENAFYTQLDFILKEMENTANNCTVTLAGQTAPFTSGLMGGLENGRDVRSISDPCTVYRASGCLVHGLSVVADSFLAVKAYLKYNIGDADTLISALRSDFRGYDTLHQFLLNQPKFGCNDDEADNVVVRLQKTVCEKIAGLKNPSGAPFLADFSTPSTHLLYGYHVGATPDGRNARTSLGYGIDPLPRSERKGYLMRLLSQRKLDFSLFNGGYASHLGLSPALFSAAESTAEKMQLFRDKIIKKLFRFSENKFDNAPFYVYFNIDSAVHLREVLADPAKYAPDGIYIMRIHGTFVNFLDLSPAIQEDIIVRLEKNTGTSVF